MSSPAPDLDTAMVLGMASTALPFADSMTANWIPLIVRAAGACGRWCTTFRTVT